MNHKINLLNKISVIRAPNSCDSIKNKYDNTNFLTRIARIKKTLVLKQKIFLQSWNNS